MLTYLTWGELVAVEVAAAAAAAAAAAIELMPGSWSFWEAVVEAELGREIGSRGAGSGSMNPAPSSILMARKFRGGSWHGWSGGGVKAGCNTGSGSRGERVGARLTVGERREGLAGRVVREASSGLEAWAARERGLKFRSATVVGRDVPTR